MAKFVIKSQRGRYYVGYELDKHTGYDSPSWSDNIGDAFLFNSKEEAEHDRENIFDNNDLYVVEVFVTEHDDIERAVVSVLSSIEKSYSIRIPLASKGAIVSKIKNKLKL